MYYEINVSKKDEKLGWDGQPSYRHLFATHERSCTNIWETKRVLAEISARFPAPEFKINIMYNPQRYEGWSSPEAFLSDKDA